MPLSDQIDQIEGKISTQVDRLLKDMRQAIRERLSRGHEELLHQLDELSLDVSKALVSREQLEMIERKAASDGRGEALADLLAGLGAIDEAGSQADVLAALLAAGRRFSGRVLVLLTRDDEAEVWGGSGWQEAEIEGVRLGYDEGAAWTRLAAGRGVVALRSSDCAPLCSRLESAMPLDGVLVPLVLRDHVAAALYADREDEGEKLETAALQALAFAAAQAIETLPFRQRAATPTLRPADDEGDEEGLPLWPADGMPADGVPAAGAAGLAGAETARVLTEVEEAVEAEAVVEEAAEEDELGEAPWEVEEEAPDEDAGGGGEAVADDGGTAVAEPGTETIEFAEAAAADVEKDVEKDAEEGAEEAARESEEEAAAGFDSFTEIGELEDIDDLELDDLGGETPLVTPAATVAEEPPAEEEKEEEEDRADDEPLAAATHELEMGETTELAPPDVATADEAADGGASDEAAEPAKEEAEAGAPPTGDDVWGRPAESEVAEPPAEADDMRATRMIEQPSFDSPAPAPPPPSADDTMTGAQVTPPSDVDGPGWAFAKSETAARGSDEESLHEEARRLARLLVSEVRLYNEEQIDEGRRNQDIYDRVKDDIDRARRLYEERVDPSVTETTDYFYQELVRILANGDAEALGV